MAGAFGRERFYRRGGGGGVKTLQPMRALSRVWISSSGPRTCWCARGICVEGSGLCICRSCAERQEAIVLG